MKVAFVSAIFVLICSGVAQGSPFPPNSFPEIIFNSLGSAPCLQQAFPDLSALITSTDMTGKSAQTTLSLPFDLVADYILNPSLLATWNGDYSSGGPQQSLPICQKLLATFTTKINVSIPAGYSFKPPIILTVNRTSDVGLFGWQFGVSSSDEKEVLYYGAHWIGVFRVIENGQEAVHFLSWEKISGQFVAEHRAAFEYGLSKTVLQKDIDGGLCLDQVYALTGELDVTQVTKNCAGR